jgi:hypothetical protein
MFKEERIASVFRAEEHAKQVNQQETGGKYKAPDMEVIHFREVSMNFYRTTSLIPRTLRCSQDTHVYLVVIPRPLDFLFGTYGTQNIPFEKRIDFKLKQDIVKSSSYFASAVKMYLPLFCDV